MYPCKPHEIQQDSHKHKYRLGGEQIESSPGDNDSGILMINSIWASNLCPQPRRPTVSRVASKAIRPAGQRKQFFPSTPLMWDPTWSTVFSSGTPNTRGIRTCWSESRGGLWEHSEDKLRVLGLFSLEKRRFKRHLIAAFQYLEVASRKAGEGFFIMECSDTKGVKF